MVKLLPLIIHNTHTAIFVNQTLSTSVCFWISITQFWRMIVGGREVVIQTWVKCTTTCGMCAHRCVLYTKFSFCREKPGPCGTLLASPSTVAETQISNRAKRICYKNKVTYIQSIRFIVIGMVSVLYDLYKMIKHSVTVFAFWCEARIDGSLVISGP